MTKPKAHKVEPRAVENLPMEQNWAIINQLAKCGHWILEFLWTSDSMFLLEWECLWGDLISEPTLCMGICENDNISLEVMGLHIESYCI